MLMLYNHIIGKTILLQANIARTAKKIVEDEDKTKDNMLILCTWQEGADALLSQYEEFAKTLPKSSNMEVIVVTKEKLMKRFKATVQEFEPTTNQLNRLCKNITTMVKDKTVHLFVDECWVTVPKKYTPHLTAVCILDKRCS